MSLLPTCGRLYAEGLGALAKCEDYDRVKNLGDMYSVRTEMYRQKQINVEAHAHSFIDRPQIIDIIIIITIIILYWF